MKKLNKNGVTLVELIVSFAIVSVAVIYFFQVLSTVKTIYQDTNNETNKYVDKSYVIHILNEYLSGKYIISEPVNEDNLFKNVCDKYHLGCTKISLVSIGDDNDEYEGTISGLTNGGYRIQNIQVTMPDTKKITFPIKSRTLNNNVNTYVMPLAFIAAYDSNGNSTGFPKGLDGVKTNVIVATNGKSKDDNVMEASVLFDTIYDIKSGGSITINYDMSTACPSPSSNPNSYYNRLTNNTTISAVNIKTGAEITNLTCEKSLVNEDITENNRWENQDLCIFQNLDEGEYKIKVSVERNNNESPNKGIRCGVYTAINSVKVSN